MNLSGLSDQALMDSLRAVCASSRRLLAELLLHLIEVEERRLELRSACPSLYDFCTDRLGMSDGEACRRIAAARIVKRFPSLLARIESGALNLTTLVLLRDLLTETNVEAIAEAASGKTKREVEKLVAQLAPKPDVPAMVVALPVNLPGIEVPAKSPEPARITPLSVERYEVRFTADSALHDKIERARDLLRHRNPSGDLEAVMHRAFDALLKQLEKERLGKVDHPQQNPKPTTTDEIPAAVRRAVFDRDGEQCTFLAADGTRCPARDFLELDHIDAKSRGGAPTAENLRVYCRAHNRYHAEQEFGRDHIDTKIHQRQRGWPALLETTKSALVQLGFRPKEAHRALEQLVARDTELPPIETLLREALAILT